MKSNIKISTTIFERSTFRAGFTFGAFFTFAFGSGAGCNHDPSHQYDPKRFSIRSQSGVMNALNSQASVGQDLSNTVWNHHFDVGSSDLNQLGRNHLSSYVRRSMNCPQQVLLQTAYDVKARQDNIDEFLRQRAKLDSNRIEALNEYLVKFYQIPSADIVVYDPAPASIHSEEIMRSQRLMVRDVKGFLPPETTRSAFQFGGGEGMDYGLGQSMDFSGGNDPFGLGNDQGTNSGAAPFGTDGATSGFGSEIPAPSSSGSTGTEGGPIE